MSVLDEIDETFATEAEEATETETEEGKNGTSEGDEVEGAEGEEGEGEEGEEKPEGEETEEKKEPEKGEKKPKNGVQKRIDTLTKEKYELQRRVEELERGSQPKRKMPEPPDPRNFQTLSEFNIAKAKYETAVDFTKQQIADDEAREKDTLTRSVAEKVSAEKVKFEDFDDVVRNVSDIALNDDVMYALVLNDPNGVDTLYWMGKHRAEAEKISRLKPAEQAIALGRISANIKRQQTGKQVSGAPKPPAKVGGKGGSAPVNLKKMSGDEYITWRKSQEAKKSKK